MSYCRFSCDSFRSMVYCYEDCSGGYTTHVAASKALGDVPRVPNFPFSQSEADIQAWFAAHQAMMAYLDTAERAPIGLPVDGESFNDATLPEFLNRLLWLRAIGYYVPQHAIDAVQAEILDLPPES